MITIQVQSKFMHTCIQGIQMFLCGDYEFLCTPKPQAFLGGWRNQENFLNCVTKPVFDIPQGTETYNMV